MTLTSSIQTAKRGSKSLRTTIPVTVAELLKLDGGDGLEWEVQTGDGGVKVLVRKAQ